MTAQTTVVDGKTHGTPVSVSDKRKVTSQSTPVGITLVVVFGIAGSFLTAAYFQDKIDAYQYVSRQGLHNPIYGIVAVTVYLLLIYYVIPRYMKNREPKQLTTLKMIHNYLLTAFSAVALYKALKEIATVWVSISQPGLFWKAEGLLCDSANLHARNNNLYFWFHLYYLSKFYELLDTVFICFAKKEPIVLHVYHHIITLWTIWLGMEQKFACQWIIMTANCLIHVFMYYYYLLQTLGYSVWWKRYLTSLQIFQFIVDEGGILSWGFFTLYGIQCQASWFIFFYALFVITSFLVLFLQFYSRTYNPAARSDRQKRPKEE